MKVTGKLKRILVRDGKEIPTFQRKNNLETFLLTKKLFKKKKKKKRRFFSCPEKIIGFMFSDRNEEENSI